MKQMEKSEFYIVLMGLILVFNGAFFVIKNLVVGTNDSLGELASNLIEIFGGLAAIFWFRKEMIKGVAFCLLVIGVSCICSDFEYLYDEDLIIVIESLLYVVTGVVLVYYSISLALGLKTGSAKGILCLAVLGCLELFIFLSVAHRGEPLTDNEWGSLVLAIEHSVIIFILTRKEMMLPSFTRRLRDDSDTLFNNMVTDSSLYIERADVGRLTDLADGPEWTHIEDGPIERESVVALRGQNVGTELLLQIWKGDERLHLTVRGKGTDSYRITMSMVVEQTVLFDNDAGKVCKIRLYGRDGVFADIAVNSYDEMSKGYIGTISQIIRVKKAAKEAAKALITNKDE